MQGGTRIRYSFGENIMKKVRTDCTIGTMRCKNRVWVASGTFGYGDDCPDLVDVNRIGAIITKSLSLNPRDGNPPPRIVETPAGMINSIGLANIGVERFIAEKGPFLRSLDTAVIVNIAASTVEEYRTVLERIEAADCCDGYEINVSCPNVKEGGLSFGTNVRMTAGITRELRPLTNKPLIIKLTPNVTSVGEFARAVEQEGADAVSLINTLVGMSVDIRTRRPSIRTTTGGLSGPAIRPVALAKVYEAVQSVSIPVVGIGGIGSAEDALQFLIAGAFAVEIGTANYINPNAAVEIAEGIENFCREQSLADIDDLIGTLKTDRTVSVVKSWM
jgi:dihydroorotate dehydrogenase (NAD+) catalytic subunit